MYYLCLIVEFVTRRPNGNIAAIDIHRIWSYDNAVPLQWCHNDRDSVSNDLRFACLVNLVFRGRSVKSSNLRVTGTFVGDPPVNGGGFSSQRASNAQMANMFPCDDIIMHGRIYTSLGSNEETRNISLQTTFYWHHFAFGMTNIRLVHPDIPML